MTAEGRWMRLESVLSANPAKGRPEVGRQRRFKARKNKRSSWVVLYPGLPKVGERIRVRLANDGVQGRYVQSIIQTPLQRSDGKSVLAVSKAPVMPKDTPPPAECAPPPKPPPALVQRNPRVCEDCDGPCRPGAGKCDGCRAAA